MWRRAREAATTPTPPPAPAAREVTFEASDGEPVSALFTPAGKRAPAVVLLHEIHGRPEQWEDLVPYLHAAGFATLAYESRGTPVEQDRLPDALGALRWLRRRDDIDPRRIALVGASIGASTTVLAMATGARRTVDAAVALSPRTRPTSPTSRTPAATARTTCCSSPTRPSPRPSTACCAAPYAPRRSARTAPATASGS